MTYTRHKLLVGVSDIWFESPSLHARLFTTFCAWKQKTKQKKKGLLQSHTEVLAAYQSARHHSWASKTATHTQERKKENEKKNPNTPL